MDSASFTDILHSRLGPRANNDVSSFLSSSLSSLKDPTIFTVLALFLVYAFWSSRERLSSKEKNAQKAYGYRRTLAEGETRDIARKIADADKNCVILFGTQTGIAEDIAARLAKEGHSRFGLKTMVGNLEDYDYETLNQIPVDKVVMFILSTFGEGEPTDNAQDFYRYITADNLNFEDGSSSLPNLSFLSFGLGNSTYEHFNAVSSKVDVTLERLGGHRICPAGRGDDGEKTTEEDFLAWKETMWAALAKHMNLEEKKVIYEPVFTIIDRHDLNKDDPKVYLGEPNQLHLQGILQAPFNAHNPFLAPITASHQLFKARDRNCIHVEFDLGDSGLTYETGDHVSLMPTNSKTEVDRFLEMFGLTAKRDTVIDIKPLERTAKVSFPVPTTYDTIVRHKLEIGAPVSRQFIQQLSEYAPSPEAKKEMEKLGTDKDYFHSYVTQRQLNLAQTLQTVSGGAAWKMVPFTMLVEGLLTLQPRLYSISSSPVVTSNRFTITTKVETHAILDTEFTFNGVATKHLLALQQILSDERSPEVEYTGLFPNQLIRNSRQGLRVPAYIRPSSFRLPNDPKVPVIMVGPGTGVAPFRAFMQERAAQHKAGKDVGVSMLFYGCRNKDDFIYEKDWEEFGRVLGDKFKMITAFSRVDTGSKVYVQDKIRHRAAEIDALLRTGAAFYICGDATMAKDVSNLLEGIIAEQRGLLLVEACSIVKEMRSANKLQEDAWS
ncbi:NADPH cytochrome P450 oxidoreductase [Exophiala viscosa]|uniref:NADPH cytochrome P450 oxidoreductase n=1 Tax=Exophiala viscosa TaxID=2486360 RepID=UPI0021996D19|nr:NADPH cytochrome P450 oxidoreductase [Exophiala viscosa]